MSKIALVSANTYQIPYPVYPLGVSYLASYIQSHISDIDLKLFDFNMGSGDDFARFLRNNDFDFVGISLRNIDDVNIFAQNNFIHHYKKIIAIARENSRAVITIGGPAFSVFPEEVFSELQPDYAIKGEGEESLRQLIVLLAEGKEVRDIEGLVYRDESGIVKVNRHNRYIASPVLHVDSLWAEYYWEKSGMLNIQTKRGCPYNCVYCSYPGIDGKTVRTLDVQTVISNIEEMYYKKGIHYLFFTDSIFNIHNEYNEELAHRLIESKMNISWGAYFSPNNLTYARLKLFQQSGLTHVEFGTDSFSDKQLANMNKHFRFSDILAQSRNCEELGIFYAHFLILGGYGETEDTLNETFENSKELGFTVIFPFVGMRIYPETALCDIALKEGVISHRSELMNPVYYVSKDINLSTMEARANATGKKWFFPDNNTSPMSDRFRAKKIKGPLWEYMRY
ncbi:MAG: radical SAM protein [Bacteroidales bacterium]|nr:radical SAM protein [Bacteroidales bacterium]